MTPKELRNLKRLIKSGDEDNIRLAIALNEDQVKFIYHELRILKTFSAKRWENCNFNGKSFQFWGQVFHKIRLLREKIDLELIVTNNYYV